MVEVLEDNKLQELIDKDIPKPVDAEDLVEWRKCAAKESRIILKGVRDHIVSNHHCKEIPFVMWKALTYPFQKISDHQKLQLKDKLEKIKMDKGDTILKYMTRFTQFQDDIGSGVRWCGIKY